MSETIDTSHATAATATHEHTGLGHVMPARVLLAVWAALVALTVLTVAATYVDLGEYNLWLALAIATLKGSLVGLYFMHLRYDSPFNAIALVTSLLFVTVFIGLAMMDTEAYQYMFEPPRGVKVAP